MASAENITEKMEKVDLKEREPCIIVLGMAGSGKTSFVQVSVTTEF